MSIQCPGTSLHVTSFTRPSPALVLQATKAQPGARRTMVWWQSGALGIRGLGGRQSVM